jgi:magnesium transporter
MLIDGVLLNTQGVDSTVALVVALTLCATVICAKIIGCLLPIGAKILKLDPAVMASPFITTIVDAVSLLVYFGIAKSFISTI